MTSQIRVDEITNRSGLGTVTIYDNGFEFTGVTTFTEDVDITGGLTIGGVLTYEDVTNIDSVGVVTARSGIRVTGDSIHVESSEDRLLYLKSTDANAYLTFEDTDSSSAFANRVGTVSDGLYFSTGGGGERLRIASDGDIEYKYDDADTDAEIGATQLPHGLRIYNTNNTLGRLAGIHFSHGSAGTANAGIFHETTNTASGSTTCLGDLVFYTKNNGVSYMTEKLRITSDGKMGVGCTPETDFQVRNANGGTLKIGGSGNSATGFQIQYNNSGNTTTELLTNYRATSGNASLKLDTGTFLVATGTSGTERLRITADGKMGVGTASPNHRITLHNPGTGTFDALNITSGLTNSNGLQLGIDSTSNVFFWHTANGGIKFATNNVERMRVTNNGITFNGDTAADNALDDYEEGTWTPSLQGAVAGTGSFTPNSAGNGGIYRKVGGLVYIQGNLRGTWSPGTSSGLIHITGLPITNRGVVSGEANANYGPVNITYASGMTPSPSGYYQCGGLVIQGSNIIHVYKNNGNGGGIGNIIVSEVSTANDGVNWHFSACYAAAG